MPVELVGYEDDKVRNLWFRLGQVQKMILIKLKEIVFKNIKVFRKWSAKLAYS
jgi:hypothetical protein